MECIFIENLKELFQGKEIKVNSPNGKYAVEYNDEILGVIDIEDNLVINRKLFGNIYERIIYESNKVSK